MAQALLVAEGRALVLVLPSDAVLLNISCLREGDAILFPLLAEHLLGDQHLRVLALVVLVGLHQLVKILLGAKDRGAHAQKHLLLGGGRTEAESVARAAGSLGDAAHREQLFSGEVTGLRGVHHATVGVGEHVVVGVGEVGVGADEVQSDGEQVGGHGGFPSGRCVLLTMILSHRGADLSRSR